MGYYNLWERKEDLLVQLLGLIYERVSHQDERFIKRIKKYLVSRIGDLESFRVENNKIEIIYRNKTKDLLIV